MKETKLKRRLRIWKENNYSDAGMLYLKANNKYVNGVVGSDIKLTLMQKIQILFCKGISVFLLEEDVNV